MVQLTIGSYCPNCANIERPYYSQYYNNLYQNPCFNCANYPANGGSGVCHCILGTPKIY